MCKTGPGGIAFLVRTQKKKRISNDSLFSWSGAFASHNLDYQDSDPVYFMPPATFSTAGARSRATSGMAEPSNGRR